MNSLVECPMVGTSAVRTTSPFVLKGQCPHPPPAVVWTFILEAQIPWQDHAPSSVFTASKTWLLKAHMTDGTIHRHAVLSRATMRPSSTLPYGVKIRVKAKPLERD